MNSKILALLFSVVLIGTAGAAQARNDYRFSVPAKQVVAAANNPVLPPVAHQTNRYHHGAIASASRMLDSRRDARGTPINLAASAVHRGQKKSKPFLILASSRKAASPRQSTSRPGRNQRRGS